MQLQGLQWAAQGFVSLQQVVNSTVDTLATFQNKNYKVKEMGVSDH